MELQDAYERLERAQKDGLIPEEYQEYFHVNPEMPFLRPLRLAKVAARIGLWECSEVIRDDPDLVDSPFGRDDKYTFLALDAADEGEYERAREYFAKSDLSEKSSESLLTNKLIEQDNLEEAIEAIKKVDFSYIDLGMAQRNLGYIISKLGLLPGGPNRALDLLKELVPNPNNSDIDDKQMERSRYDYFLQTIAPDAIAQNDFATAEEAVELTDNWFGPGAAMGGGGLLDSAIESKEDPSVYPAILTLIYRKWGIGNMLSILHESSDFVRDSVKDRIVVWLQEIKTKVYEHDHIQRQHEAQLPEINKLIELYKR